MIELVEKSEADLTTWVSKTWTDSRVNLLAAGMSVDEADQNIEHNCAHLMDGEHPSPGERPGSSIWQANDLFPPA